MAMKRSKRNKNTIHNNVLIVQKNAGTVGSVRKIMVIFKWQNCTVLLYFVFLYWKISLVSAAVHLNNTVCKPHILCLQYLKKMG